MDEASGREARAECARARTASTADLAGWAAEVMVKGSDVYCWFDTEYTGLDLDRAALLQVALVLTDHALEPIVPERALALPDALRTPVGYSACLAPPADYVPNGWAREHMADVLARCAASSLTAAEADRHLAAWIDAVVGPPAEAALDRPVLAGSSLHHDWYLARRDLPLFSARLSYRQLDVTAFKLEVRNHHAPKDPPKLDKKNADAVRRWFPRLCGAVGPHDALYDAQASAAELAFYRDVLAKGGGR